MGTPAPIADESLTEVHLCVMKAIIEYREEYDKSPPNKWLQDECLLNRAQLNHAMRVLRISGYIEPVRSSGVRDKRLTNDGMRAVLGWLRGEAAV
jgi:hypothetical protein